MTWKRYFSFFGICLMVAGGALIPELCSPRKAAAQGGNLTFNVATDITCDGSAHALQSSGTARYIEVYAATGNTGTVRIGPSTVSSSRGLTVVPGGDRIIPAMPIDDREGISQHFYDLSTIYYFCSSPNTLSVGWSK